MRKKDKIELFYDLLCLLKSCLWNTEYKPDGEPKYEEIYSQFVSHAIVAMPAEQIKTTNGIDEEVRKKWVNHAYYVIYNHIKIERIQDELIQKLKEQNIRFVILKGSSASCYYPNPSLRMMGDIDIMPCREDYNKAANILYSLCSIAPEHTNESERHLNFMYKGIVVELHQRFSSFTDIAKTQYLDNLILTNISKDTKLCDEINGLVLLQHINQHLETGIGLRQIIDWIYFVNSYLNDINWITHFESNAKRVGLDTLAITITKMCKDYLGLNDSITWCDMAEKALSDELLVYILESGNFGANRCNNTDAVSNIIIQYQNPIDMLKEFQKKGVRNWTAVQKNKLLIPFAWLYETIQFLKIALERKVNGSHFLKGYIDSRARRRLMHKLDARDISLGIAKLVDGKATIEKLHH